MNPPPPSIGLPELARSLGEGRVLGEERGAAAGDCEARTMRSRWEEFGSVGAEPKPRLVRRKRWAPTNAAHPRGSI